MPVALKTIGLAFVLSLAVCCGLSLMLVVFLFLSARVPIAGFVFGGR